MKTRFNQAIYYHFVQEDIAVLGDLDLTGTANQPFNYYNGD